MNGSTSSWYDPYLNKIIEDKKINASPKHFYVALMFTQSETKPMTSIDMSINYVDTYKSWKESDAIVSIGFGFNTDDEHINGIIRTLVNDDRKKLIIIMLPNGKNEDDNIEFICEKLKISKKNNIRIVFADGDANNNKWIDDILSA